MLSFLDTFFSSCVFLFGSFHLLRHGVEDEHGGEGGDDADVCEGWTGDWLLVRYSSSRWCGRHSVDVLGEAAVRL